jgi:hypothetical protein
LIDLISPRRRGDNTDDRGISFSIAEGRARIIGEEFRLEIPKWNLNQRFLYVGVGFIHRPL